MDIINSLVSVLTGFGMTLLALFGGSASSGATLSNPGGESAAVATATAQVAASSTAQGPHAYTDAELLAMAGDDYASGNVPLGDHKYVTNGPKQGYIYLCHATTNSTAGSDVDGPWIHGTTWNFKTKTAVEGAVSWEHASFTNVLSGVSRILTTNDLPVKETTGIFPIQKTDPAYQYDKNPNGIKAQSIKVTLPAHPTYSATPSCMGGEVGIMMNGVALFDGFDEPLRDAPAHELQDTNHGHPQVSEEYHYHNLPTFWNNAAVSTVIGFAYDGFPITGPMVANGKYLTTSDLDECHGLTSTITLDGKQVTIYHYVMTYDFPYSVSCFRGKSVLNGPSVQGGGPQGGQQSQAGQQGSSQGQMQGGTPPQAALTACSGKASGASCSFTGGRGETVSGTCQTPPGSSLACVPR